MNISKASKATGLSVRMIRFYEAQGISCTARRASSGYREFGADDIATLRFIRNARDLGFELREIRQLLDHWRRGNGNAGEVVSVAVSRLTKIRSAESRISARRASLESILQSSRGRPLPDCEFLGRLAA